jgi:uncharacterized protein (TIGR02246 family)
MIRSVAAVTFLGLAILLVSGGGCERAAESESGVLPADRPAAESLPPDVQAAREGFLAAWRGDDPAAVAGYYTPDATATVGDATNEGRAEIERAWLPVVPLIAELRIEGESARQVGADWHAEGTYILTIELPDLDAVEETGRYALTWTRSPDGRWRVRSSQLWPDPTS